MYSKSTVVFNGAFSLYLANGVKGDLKITDGESFELQFFGKNELPNLESRAKVILEWLIEKEYLK